MPLARSMAQEASFRSLWGNSRGHFRVPLGCQVVILTFYIEYVAIFFSNPLSISSSND